MAGVIMPGFVPEPEILRPSQVAWRGPRPPGDRKARLVRPELPGVIATAWRRHIRACWGVRYAMGPIGIHRTLVLLEARRTLSASSAANLKVRQLRKVGSTQHFVVHNFGAISNNQ